MPYGTQRRKIPLRAADPLGSSGVAWLYRRSGNITQITLRCVLLAQAMLFTSDFKTITQDIMLFTAACSDASTNTLAVSEHVWTLDYEKFVEDRISAVYMCHFDERISNLPSITSINLITVAFT